ncbi:hypothetical protein S83_007459 [Arachis hypogaea]
MSCCNSIEGVADTSDNNSNGLNQWRRQTGQSQQQQGATVAIAPPSSVLARISASGPLNNRDDDAIVVTSPHIAITLSASASATNSLQRISSLFSAIDATPKYPGSHLLVRPFSLPPPSSKCFSLRPPPQCQAPVGSAVFHTPTATAVLHVQQ